MSHSPNRRSARYSGDGAYMTASHPSRRSSAPFEEHRHAHHHRRGSVNHRDASVHRHANGRRSPSLAHQRHRDKHERDSKHPRRKLGTFAAHVAAATSEFVGTLLFLYFAFAGQIMLATQAGETATANGGKSSQTIVLTAVIYGFSLLVNAWAFYRISGGLFNPAVTLGLVLGNALPLVRALFLLPAQILGAICAAALVKVMFSGPITDCNTSLALGTSAAKGVFIEMFMTAELVFVVLMLAVEKSKDTFIAPVGIGLALFVVMMAGVYPTGGSLNPARSLGPAVAGNTFPAHHWVYWIGPCLGAVVAAAFYRFVKLLNYEEINPGQDDTNDEAPSRRSREMTTSDRV